MRLAKCHPHARGEKAIILLQARLADRCGNGRSSDLPAQPVFQLRGRARGVEL